MIYVVIIYLTNKLEDNDYFEIILYASYFAASVLQLIHQAILQENIKHNNNSVNRFNNNYF